MPSLSTINRLLDEADRALKELEVAQSAAIESGLRKALADLEQQLRRDYAKAAEDLTGIDSGDRRQARARSLIAQTQTFLDAFQLAGRDGLDDTLKAGLIQSHQLGLDHAEAELQAYGDSIPFQGTFDPRAVISAIQGSRLRWSKHSDTFIQRAQESVIKRLVTGKPIAGAVKDLQNETGILRSKAALIIRTETINAYDHARQRGYLETGIQYVQRLATNDSRVCPYCAHRHGNIYPVGTPVVLHGHDRCVMMPYRPEWADEGIIEPGMFDDEKAEMIRRCGVPVDPGLAPFEKTLKRWQTQDVQPVYRDASDDGRKIRSRLRDAEAALLAGDLARVQKIIDDLAKSNLVFSPSLQERFDGLRVSLLQAQGKTPTSTKLSNDDDMRKARQLIRAAEAALVDGDHARVRANLEKLKAFGLTASLQARVDAIKQNIGQTVTVKPLPPITKPAIPVAPVVKPPIPPVVPPVPVPEFVHPVTEDKINFKSIFKNKSQIDRAELLLNGLRSGKGTLPDLMAALNFFGSDPKGLHITPEQYNAFKTQVEKLVTEKITPKKPVEPTVTDQIRNDPAFKKAVLAVRNMGLSLTNQSFSVLSKGIDDLVNGVISIPEYRRLVEANLETYDPRRKRDYLMLVDDVMKFQPPIEGAIDSKIRNSKGFIRLYLELRDRSQMLTANSEKILVPALISLSQGKMTPDDFRALLETSLETRHEPNRQVYLKLVEGLLGYQPPPDRLTVLPTNIDEIDFTKVVDNTTQQGILAQVVQQFKEGKASRATLLQMIDTYTAGTRDLILSQEGLAEFKAHLEKLIPDEGPKPLNPPTDEQVRRYRDIDLGSVFRVSPNYNEINQVLRRVINGNADPKALLSAFDRLTKDESRLVKRGKDLQLFRARLKVAVDPNVPSLDGEPTHAKRADKLAASLKKRIAELYAGEDPVTVTILQTGIDNLLKGNVRGKDVFDSLKIAEGAIRDSDLDTYQKFLLDFDEFTQHIKLSADESVEREQMRANTPDAFTIRQILKPVHTGMPYQFRGPVNQVAVDHVVDTLVKARAGKTTPITVEYDRMDPASDQLYNGYGGNEMKARVQKVVDLYEKVLPDYMLPRGADRKLIFSATPDGRGFYSSSSFTSGGVFLSRYSRDATILHEIGHHLEYRYDPNLYKYTIQWVMKKAKGKGKKKLSILAPQRGYGPDEEAYPDEFIDEYVGKTYTNATEVISMGMEEMFRDPAGFAAKDPEHFDLIWNLLTGRLDVTKAP